MISMTGSCACNCARCEDPAAYHGHCGKPRRGCGLGTGIYEPRRPTPARVEAPALVDGLTPEEQALLAQEEAALGREITF